MSLYPLRFRPILKQYIWGGRRLQTLLGKQLPDGAAVAESWEIADHGNDQSIIAWGSLAGSTLGQLVTTSGSELLGRHHPQSHFPLILKFLDAHQPLSVQVHPDDDHAARLPSPDVGKTEAWIVLAADPGSRIYAGLKSGCDREQLRRGLADGTLTDCLHSFEPSVGDCVLVPAGVVHALDRGLVVAEVQQSSDTTYRLYDWGRTTDGQPRPLQVDEALAAIDYQFGPASPQRPTPGDQPYIERLVLCDKFVIERWKPQEPVSLGGDGQCHLLMVLSGSVAIAGDPAPQPLWAGETALLPASLGQVQLSPADGTAMLHVHLP